MQTIQEIYKNDTFLNYEEFTQGIETDRKKMADIAQRKKIEQVKY